MSLVLQDKCNIEIFLSPVHKGWTSERTKIIILVLCLEVSTHFTSVSTVTTLCGKLDSTVSFSFAVHLEETIIYKENTKTFMKKINMNTIFELSPIRYIEYRGWNYPFLCSPWRVPYAVGRAEILTVSNVNY